MDVGGEQQQCIGRNNRVIRFSRQPMLVLAFLGIAGIAIDRILPLNSQHWLLLLLTTAAFLLASWNFDHLRRWFVLIMFVAVAGISHHSQYYDYDSDTLAAFMDDDARPMIVRAVMRSPIEYRPDTLALQRGKPEAEAWQSVFDVEAVSISGGMIEQTASGRARVVVYGVVTDLLYGDVIELACHGQRIPATSNPGEVDLQQIYRFQRQLVRLRCDRPQQVKLLSHGQWSLGRMFNVIGNRGHAAIKANLNPASVPLAEALVLGRRQAVDREVKDRLLETGTIHLLAVSGLHVGIVAIAVGWLALAVGLSRTITLVLIIGTALTYMMVTGSRPPVVRAALLVSIIVTGRMLGRRTDALNSLATAGVVLMIVDPLSISQIGTHLSFLAVTTIILVSRTLQPSAEQDPLDILINRSRSRIATGAVAIAGAVKQMVLISFWIGCIAMPLVWYHFHIVSPISILANVLLWIPLTIALIAGLCTAVLGSLWEPLGYVPGTVCDNALQLITHLVDWLANIESGHYWLPSPALWMIFLFYVAMILLPLVVNERMRRMAVVGFVAIWAAGAFALSSPANQADRFIATFIDVGHGTSVLLQFPDGETWLYDAGRLGDPSFARWPIEAVLWASGVRHLDRIVVSHADADHYNAIEGLSERFGIAQVVTSHELFPSDQAGVASLHRLLIDKQIPIERTADGDTLMDDNGIRVAVLHPPRKHVVGKDNANSVVLKIEAFGQTLLLPGDLELPGTAMLLTKDRPPPGGVLMAPHHGSLSEDIYPLLKWADPKYIVASGGKRARHPRVLGELTETGAQAFITARDGAVQVTFNSAGIQVRSYNADPW